MSKQPALPTDQLGQELITLVSKLERLQNHVIVASGSGLTYKTYRGLTRILDGRNTLAKLGETASTTYAAISQGLSTLQASGFVVRQRGSSDKRTAHFVVADQGIDAVLKTEEALSELFAALFSGLDRAELVQLRRLLGVLRSNVDDQIDHHGLRPADRAGRKSSCDDGGEAVPDT